MYKITLLLLLVSALVADNELNGEYIPPVRTYSDCVTYNTPDEAAIAAVSESFIKSKNYEMGGIIYKIRGKFCYSPPVTQLKPNAVRFTISVIDKQLMVALYHTHPLLDDTEYHPTVFSDVDVSTTWSFSVPFYVGILTTSEVRKMNIDSILTVYDNKLICEGDLVGKIEPVH